MLASQLHAPCAVCGVSSADGLFPPSSGGSDLFRPDAGPRVPLCTFHKTEFLRGELPFPRWCTHCDAYRPAGHDHPRRRH